MVLRNRRVQRRALTLPLLHTYGMNWNTNVKPNLLLQHQYMTLHILLRWNRHEFSQTYSRQTTILERDLPANKRVLNSHSKGMSEVKGAGDIWGRNAEREDLWSRLRETTLQRQKHSMTGNTVSINQLNIF